MSGIAIVSVAAVCAGYLWLERHQVGRAAKARAIERRRIGVLRGFEPGPIQGPPASELLERRIEDAVGSADFAWAYHERLFLRGASGESPFQFRRTRVDAAQRRFAQASLHIQEQANAWLSSTESEPTQDEQCKLAVDRMQRWLTEHPVPERFPVGDDQLVVATVDVLENVLANLRRRRQRGTGADPFRHEIDAAAGHDVTSRPERVSTRHTAAVSVTAYR